MLHAGPNPDQPRPPPVLIASDGPVIISPDPEVVLMETTPVILREGDPPLSDRGGVDDSRKLEGPAAVATGPPLPKDVIEPSSPRDEDEQFVPPPHRKAHPPPGFGAMGGGSYLS